jgi:hypothetical protein
MPIAVGIKRLCIETGNGIPSVARVGEPFHIRPIRFLRYENEVVCSSRGSTVCIEGRMEEK